MPDTLGVLQLQNFVNIYRTVPLITPIKHYFTGRVTSSSMLPNVDWWKLLKFRKNITDSKGNTVQEDCSWIALPSKRRWFTNRHDVIFQKTCNTAMRTSDVAVTCSPQPPALWGQNAPFSQPWKCLLAVLNCVLGCPLQRTELPC